MKKSLLFLLVFLCLKLGAEHTLSVCAIFKDEAPYLKEWIEYHKIVGVEHFYLYNNGSEDHYLAVLTPYIEQGEVTLIDWPNRKAENKIWAWVYSTQVSAYEHAFKLAKDASKWIAAIDIDEFIVPVKTNTIPEILERYDKHFPGIEVFWRVFGTSDVEEFAPGDLILEKLRRKSFALNPLNQSCKTILKAGEYKRFFWPPHRCDFQEGRQAYRTDPKEIVIQHYINRSKNYFFSSKIRKKEQMDNVRFKEEEIEQMLRVGNDLEDLERHTDRFLPKLKSKMHVKERKVALIADFNVGDFAIFPSEFKNRGITLEVAAHLEENHLSAEKIVIFNQVLDPRFFAKIPKEKLIYFLWEPWEVPEGYYDNFSKVYTWDDERVDGVHFFKLYYPHLMPMQNEKIAFEKKKLCVMVAKNDLEPKGRKNDLYSERIRMVEFFETKPRGELDIYGQRWLSRLYRDYKGAIPGWHSGKEKIDTLSNYRFCICFENTKNIKGYVTEKIFCCFAAGCVPIYWGASNVESYIPKDCYIDYRDFKSKEELYQFLKSMTPQQHAAYLGNIRAFIKSEQAAVFSTPYFQQLFLKAIQ